MKVKEVLVKDRLLWGQVFLSAVGTWGLLQVLEIGLGEISIANTLVGTLIFGVLLFAYRRGKTLKKRENVFAWIFTLILAIIVVIGGQLEFTSGVVWNLMTPLKIICVTFALYPITRIVLTCLARVTLKNIQDDISMRKLSWIAFAVILVGGFLVWLALWPGIYGWDSAALVAQIKSGDLTSHWSLFLGVIFAWFLDLGNNLFGSYQVGMAIAMLMQLLVMTYIATRITIFATKQTKNWYIYMLSILFFGFFPFYTAMTVYSTQDTLFAGVFALIIVNLVELATNRARWWEQKSRPVSLAILILLLCLIRNNGMYCILILIPFALIICKEHRWTLALILVAPLVAYQVYTGPIYSLMRVNESSGLREMLSVPSQQLARAYTYQSSQLSQDEVEELGKFYSNSDGLNNLLDYPIFMTKADRAKNALNITYTSEHLAEYVKLWGSIGIKTPRTYTDAFLLSSLGVWYPNKNFTDERSKLGYLEFGMADTTVIKNNEVITIERDSKFPLYRDMLEKITEENTWRAAPIVSTITTVGSYFVLWIFIVGIIIVRKDWRLLVPMAPVLGLYITLFLAPVAIFRYCFPVVILLPVWVSLLFKRKRY